MKKLENPSFQVKSFILKLRLDEFINITEIIPSLELLKAKDIGVCLYDFNKHFNLADYRVFEYISYLEIDILDTENQYFHLFLSTLKDNQIINILNHRNNTVTKSMLEKYNIIYLDGSMYPKYENVNGIV